MLKGFPLFLAILIISFDALAGEEVGDEMNEEGRKARRVRNSRTAVRERAEQTIPELIAPSTVMYPMPQQGNFNDTMHQMQQMAALRQQQQMVFAQDPQSLWRLEQLHQAQLRSHAAATQSQQAALPQYPAVVTPNLRTPGAMPVIYRQVEEMVQPRLNGDGVHRDMPPEADLGAKRKVDVQQPLGEANTKRSRQVVPPAAKEKEQVQVQNPVVGASIHPVINQLFTVYRASSDPSDYFRKTRWAIAFALFYSPSEFIDTLGVNRIRSLLDVTILQAASMTQIFGFYHPTDTGHTAAGHQAMASAIFARSKQMKAYVLKYLSGASLSDAETRARRIIDAGIKCYEIGIPKDKMEELLTLVKNGHIVWDTLRRELPYLQQMPDVDKAIQAVSVLEDGSIIRAE